MDTKNRYFWTVAIMRAVSIYFVCGTSIAMLVYPGGNIHNNAQAGYSFLYNFLSDLGMHRSHSGEANFFSSLFFNTSMITFSLIAISFVFVPDLFKSTRLTHLIAICGSCCLSIGALFFSAVGLTPADLYLDTHIFFAINAPRWIAAGTFLYFIVFHLSDAAKFYLISIASFFFLVLSYAVYQFLTRGDTLSTIDNLTTQVLTQKAIVIIMIFSILVMSYAFEDQLKKNNAECGY